jgi:hypothetical protein
MTSSVKLFHSLQAGHLPAHFADSYPQLVQKKADFDLLMGQRYLDSHFFTKYLPKINVNILINLNICS